MFRIACERIGKRIHAPRIPWSDVVRCTPLWAGVFSLICHEYPLGRFFGDQDFYATLLFGNICLHLID